MVGVAGKTGRHKNRSNQWIAGKERLRTDEAFSFKPKLELINAIKADMEKRQISKTEWLDLAANRMIEQDATAEIAISEVLQDAITTSIGLKQAAIRSEKKKPANRRDQALINKWEAEIEQLENFLS
jgi:hypothetical protein